MIERQPVEKPAPFDALAASYDAGEAANPILQWMRQRLQQAALPTFAGGRRLLEIGSGTGTDAVFFARQGFTVVGVEPAAAMLAVAQAKVNAAGCAPRVRLVQTAAEALAPVTAAAPFDGMFSNFGALNCVADLRGFAEQAARVLRPGAPVFLVVMPPLCPWEITCHLLCGRPRTAFRRWLGRHGVLVNLAGSAVRTCYFTPAEMRACFAPWFVLVRQFSVGLLVPPPYVRRLACKPAWLRALAHCEEKIADWPVLRNWGDHVALLFRRR
ncbi:MAG: methyltransferase domain-containing protein [candidate division KSB1 bacterium]|nr:methyltransferase domain-containing protein [candidate division KSB1 bacterium]MDZ7410774.1 methyltransferase domain-containing protein [candidate division KSB1 bacterium]